MESADQDSPIVTLTRTHDDVDWAAIIRNAKQIDIVVHYYDSWVREHYQEFAGLFKRGGRVRLIIPDPEHVEVMSSVQREFFPRHTVERITEKIFATAQNLREAIDAADSPDAKLEIYAFPAALHYAAVIADDRQLHLSVYEQFRGTTIGSQVFHIELIQDRQLCDYWNENIKQFIESSRRL